MPVILVPVVNILLQMTSALIPIQSKPPKATFLFSASVNKGFLCIIFFVIYHYFIVFYILLDIVQLCYKKYHLS